VRWRKLPLTENIRCDPERQELAGRRPSSLSASGLILDGRRSTRLGHTVNETERPRRNDCGR
jgi:hypothetical protein